jgi:GNAT superfamily N-acetyltransferase
MKQIIYQREEQLGTKEFTDVLKRSTLAERRPVGDEKRIAEMLAHANIIYTARHDGLLVGVARSLSDFVYCTYLSDLAVDERYQKMGIGKELIKLTKLASPQATLILLSAPAAVDYYPKIGMQLHEHCYLLKDSEDIK